MIPVSVIIPIYNVERYIERCARSLFEQTMDNIEYVFVNDCTPDNSIVILKRVLSDYPHRSSQVIIIDHEYNKGLPQARKTGILEATGDYVIHCDSDDWIDKDMYEKMYNKAVEENSDMVLCRYKLNDGEKTWEDPSFTKPIKNEKNGSIKQLLNWEISGSLCTKLVKRTLYTNDIIYPKDNMCEDITLSVQLLLRSHKLSVIEEALYNYFINNSSICHQSDIEVSRKIALQTINNAKIIEVAISQFQLTDLFRSDLLVLKSRVMASSRSLPWKQYVSACKKDLISLLVARNISFRNKIGHLLKIVGIYNHLGRY